MTAQLLEIVAVFLRKYEVPKPRHTTSRMQLSRYRILRPPIFCQHHDTGSRRRLSHGGLAISSPCSACAQVQFLFFAGQCSSSSIYGRNRLEGGVSVWSGCVRFSTAAGGGGRTWRTVSWKSRTCDQTDSDVTKSVTTGGSGRIRGCRDDRTFSVTDSGCGSQP